MDEDARAALSRSPLGGLPKEVLEDLTAGSVRIVFPAATLVHRAGDSAAHLEVVLRGLLRVYVAAADGRTMTVRYGRAGDLLGVMSLFTPAFAMPASVQALVDAELLALSPDRARRAATQDGRVAAAFLAEQGQRAVSFLHEVPGSAFASVRQRVGRHLLDLATRDGPELSAHVSQQQLAEAVGTVREVVVRVLRDLRAAGIVRTERDRIVLVDPHRLVAEQGWNPGS